MITNKIFTGATCDGKDRLFYVIYEKDNGLFYIYFEDVLTKERFTFHELLDLNPFAFTNKKIISRRKVIEIYKKDRRQVIDLTKLFFANIDRVEKLSIWKRLCGFDARLNQQRHFIQGLLLFLKIDENSYLCLQNNKVYSKENNSYDDDMFCISDIREFDSNEFWGDLYVSKREVLENGYQKKLKRVNK